MLRHVEQGGAALNLLLRVVQDDGERAQRLLGARGDVGDRVGLLDGLREREAAGEGVALQAGEGRRRRRRAWGS